jgi:hypothetical protein
MGADCTAYGCLPWRVPLPFLRDCRNLDVRHDLAPSATAGKASGLLRWPAQRLRTLLSGNSMASGKRLFGSFEFPARRESKDVMSLTSLCPRVFAGCMGRAVVSVRSNEPQKPAVTTADSAMLCVSRRSCKLKRLRHCSLVPSLCDERHRKRTANDVGCSA